MNVARLILPAVRWPGGGGGGGGGADAAWAAAGPALEAGVGGFILFGGDAAGVRAFCERAREAAGYPLLLATDAERGAGQQFRGATSLPPAQALAALADSLDAARTAARITARELRALGLNWALAPVADLDLEPRNPIIGTRAFGAEPVHVCEHVRAWVEACQAEGVLACAKHFPGHGRTTVDSHVELPAVGAGLGSLEADWAPFRAALDAGVASVMGAHVAYPALDPSGAPATLSRPILTGLLRERFGFDGLIVSDALTMEGVLRRTGSEGEAAVQALEAGTDLLLYPKDRRAVEAALRIAVTRGRLDSARVERSIVRVEAALRSVNGSEERGELGGEGARWALDAARRSITLLTGGAEGAGAAGQAGDVEVALVDDDVLRMTPETLRTLGLAQPPPPPSRAPFLEALRERAGARVRVLDDREPWGGSAEAVVACFADVRGYKGRAGLSREAEAAVARRLRHRPDAAVVLFGHPRLAAAWPHARTLLCAWSGDEVMQRAAAHRLADLREGRG